MKKSKRILSILLSMVMVFGAIGASGINAMAASSVSKTYSVKAFVNTYTAKLSANLTTTKLTASTYYESKAKYLVTVGIATRTDKNSNGNYNTDMDDASMTNVTGKTASITLSSGSKRYSKAFTEHAITTTSDESIKTYNLTV